MAVIMPISISIVSKLNPGVGGEAMISVRRSRLGGGQPAERRQLVGRRD